MKLGISSYSLNAAIESGEMDLFEAIRWIAGQGAEHVEIVPLSGIRERMKDERFVANIRRTAMDAGLELSNYAVGGNFADKDDAALKKEIDRIKEQVDIARELGVKLMRHDVAKRPPGLCQIGRFEAELPAIVQACQEIADYAAGFGITTSLENHGYFVQASDRVLRVMQEVNRSNYKTTIDVGNFMVADEDPHIAVAKLIPYASMVHVKDFYLRTRCRHPGEGWFETLGGNYLRGAIAGCGSLDMHRILSTIKSSGYAGYISIEFEGMEPSRLGARIAFDNVRRIWDEV
ncbi:sugar phosphate isomerase/epimerase family protein [Paenibacillus ginsengarvi]|uniref:Sugar phosphate isomerase/epimerase n=1 Tax=Paenibacillus ginsengarvi TaxID=400777 RepID=A0A3B0BCS6_9BACL|nr:sugar phosphate isomerase/epimerase [Paenibacillus ginsengarvi]RKN70154.1 sugar phosphate isomerase/epimerase [Paenibacillus ginsengarvi]